MPRRVALVASHVIQYQDPFFRMLAADPSIDLTVLFCSSDGARVYRDAEMQTELKWDVELLQGYPYRFLRNFGFGSGYGRALNPGIISELLFGRYDAVIFFLGWGTITSLLGIAAARARGLPFFLYGDSSFPPEATSSLDQLRAGFLRAVFAMASGFLVSGRLNAAYYEAYGADRSRFFSLPWAVDNERFERASSLTRADREQLRRSLGAREEDVLFVFSAKLLPRKDPLTLLRAQAQMKHRQRAVVLFLGDGQLRGELKEFVDAHESRAHFAGFVNQIDLPRHYGAGDVFVLPSLREPRGAVINEAMASGLPLIVSDRCGSLGDIALDGDNALVFPAGDAAILAAQMDVMIEDSAARVRMGQRSREIIRGWSYSRGVDGVKEALDFTC